MNKIRLFKVHQPPHTRYLEETMKSGQYAEGPRVIEFEQQLQKFIGSQNNAVVNSGTSALFLAMYLTGLGPGKSIITAPITSPATNISIPRLYGKIIWADVDPGSGNISPESVGRLLDKHKDSVAAVIAVDWGGMPCDFDALNQVIDGRVPLIHDAAHALGSSYKGKLSGAHADYTCFSFQAIKHITTGDGGMLCCKDDEQFKRAKRLRWFGIDRAKPNRAFADDLLEAGFKFHMNDIAASVGLAQLEDLPQILERRRKIARYYEQELVNVCDFQKVDYPAESAYWLFTLKANNRDTVMKALAENDIDSSPVHCRNDWYTAFKECTLDSDISQNTIDFDQKMLCIPVGDWLSDSDAERVVETLKKTLV